MKIVTVSREFGSGGRELGKRLADELGFAYYDREIITAIAEQNQFHEGYVENVLDNGAFSSYPITFGRTFSAPVLLQQNATAILVAQQKILRDLVAKGQDCVIVGRCADVILKEHQPLNLFVYADMDSKVHRCQERANEGEKLTYKEMEKQIKRVENGRARYRELLTDGKWGRKEHYHLCINTTGQNIKGLTRWVADYARYWFSQQ